MKSSRTYTAKTLAAVLLWLFAEGSAFSQSQHREISRGKEKKLVVSIDIAFGSIMLEKGDREKIAIIDYEEEKEDDHKFHVAYDVEGETGRLKVKLKKSKSLWNENDDESRYRRITVKLTNSLPVWLDLELGAGKGDIDLTGLQIKDLKISSGASSIELRCDQLNRLSAERIEIESGVSKFTATNLCNVNFRELKFSGGVGAYKLDFGGELTQDANAEIEVGLGSIVVYIPKEVATKLIYDDNWFSSFDLDRGFKKRKDGVYESVSDDGGKLLTLKIESGLGSVKVKRK